MRVPKNIKALLWEVDSGTVDLQKHKDFIIARVADKGAWKDVLWLRKKYGDAGIRRVVKKSKNVSSRVKNFWQIF